MADLYGDALQEDLAVYSFDALDENELLGGTEHDLAHLLDEGLNDLNDETFGDSLDGPAVQQPGRDFDFAGSTSRFLGTDAAHSAGLHQQQQQHGGRQLDKLGAQWGADPLLSSASPAASRSLSPWTSLNDDPLLGARATPVALPHAAPAQPQQQRQFKTLDEVEAEMRAANAARQQSSSAAAAPPRGMTVEELEADLLRKQQQAPPPPQPQQQQPQQQLPPGMSPQPGAMLPPGMPQQGAPYPPPPPGFLPPGFPPLPPQIQALPPQMQAQFVAQVMAQHQGRFPPPPLGAPMPPPGAFAQGHPGAAGPRPDSLGGQQQPGVPAHLAQG
ncbi:hypothetical protein JCM9279_004427, partial [Rhodotorula babjevae]